MRYGDIRGELSGGKVDLVDDDIDLVIVLPSARSWLQFCVDLTRALIDRGWLGCRRGGDARGSLRRQRDLIDELAWGGHAMAQSIARNMAEVGGAGRLGCCTSAERSKARMAWASRRSSPATSSAARTALRSGDRSWHPMVMGNIGRPCNTPSMQTYRRHTGLVGVGVWTASASLAVARPPIGELGRLLQAAARGDAAVVQGLPGRGLG